MIGEIGGATTQLVSLALDAALLRHQVLANNIANAKTPGFHPGYVTFEEYLGQAALALPGSKGDAALKSQVTDLRQRLESGQLTRVADGEVQVDQEMARLSANVVHYQALIEALTKRNDLVKIAMTSSGGR